MQPAVTQCVDPHRHLPDVDPDAPSLRARRLRVGRGRVRRGRAAAGSAAGRAARPGGVLDGRHRAALRRLIRIAGGPGGSRVEGVDRAGRAWVERVERPQDLEGPRRDRRRVSRRAPPPTRPGGPAVPRRAVPGAGVDDLVARTDPVPDRHPVAEGAAGRLAERPAQRLLAATTPGPSGSGRQRRGRRSARFVGQLGDASRSSRSAITCASTARATSRPSVPKRSVGPDAERRDGLSRRPAMSRRPAAQRDEDAGERADLHRLVVVAGRLEPAVLRGPLERRVRAAAGRRTPGSSGSSARAS